MCSYDIHSPKLKVLALNFRHGILRHSCAFLVIWTIACTSHAAPPPVTLITQDEANEPNGNPPKLTKTRSILAPKINVIEPAGNPINGTTFRVKIGFSPGPDAQIDVGSLKLDVLKVIRLSIVDRVKDYVSPSGIDVPRAQVPRGNYTIEIAVSDTKGRTARMRQNWDVR